MVESVESVESLESVEMVESVEMAKSAWPFSASLRASSVFRWFR